MFRVLQRKLQIITKSSGFFKYAVVSNTVIGVLLRGVGDGIQQTIERRQKRDEFKPQLAIENKSLPSLTPISPHKSNNEVTKNVEEPLKQQPYDWLRTRNISASGLVIGPLCYYWYVYLDKILPAKTLGIVMKKILYDQLVGATVFTFLFIMTVCLLDGMSWNESLKEFVHKFPYIYLVDWLIWPPSQAINFLFVPKEFRVIYINVLLVLWNVFMSFAKYNVNV